MKKWITVVGSVVFLVALLITQSASAQNYQAIICNNCDETEAKAFALLGEFNVKHACSEKPPSKTDHAQACVVKSNPILVANASTEKIWGFHVFYTGLGTPLDDMRLSAQPFTVSNKTQKVMKEIIKTYAQLDEVIQSVNHKLLPPSRVLETIQLAPSGNCGNNLSIAAAIGAAFSPRTNSKLLELVQDTYQHKYPDQGTLFSNSHFTGSNFSVSTDNINIEGTREVINKHRLIVADFSDAKTSTTLNRIAYNVYLQNHVLGISVNENASRIDGIAISALSAGALTNTHPCMLEHLNKYWEASAQSSASGGHFGDGGLTDYGRGFNFVPQPSNGGGGGSETCTWRFYNPQGEPTFTMKGPCP